MIALFCVGERPHAKYTVASLKKHMPDHEFVQITDYSSKEIEGVDRVIRKTITGHMMFDLIQSYADVDWKDTLITTADDCIFEGPFPINGDYDVAIVKRKSNGTYIGEKHPYTNGLVIVKNKEFYIDCLKRLVELRDQVCSGRNYWDWWGDMACISDVCESGKYKVKLLPEDQYCVKPKFNGDGNDKAVLWHYAGTDRKAWMDNHGKGK